MKTKMKLKKFSLIELMTVIVVLSVLVSMVVPATQRAKGMANRVDCMNNLKQQGLSFSMYIDEEVDRWPPYANLYRPGEISTWVLYVKEYKGKGKHQGWDEFPGQGKGKGKWETTEGERGWFNESSRNIYVCPSDPDPTELEFYDSSGTYYSEVLVSYSYNLSLHLDDILNNRLVNHDKLVVLFDAKDMVQHQGSFTGMSDFYDNVLSERHSKGGNHLFADFHVEWKPVITDENVVPEVQ